MREITIDNIRLLLMDCRAAYYDATRDTDAEDESSSDTPSAKKTISERVINAYHMHVILKMKAVLYTSEKTDKVIDFQNLLQENWDFIKGTLLCYTALPDHIATRLMIRIAYYVAQKTERPIVNCLMPTLATETIHEQYPDITTLLPIRQLLRTHILSDNSDYPIPVRTLTLHDLSSGPIGRLLNPYFDFSTHPDHYVSFSEKEMARLKMHSSESEAFFNLIEQYHELLGTEDNLLMRLQTLIRLMAKNGVNGLGTELVAARGGMIAVSDFFEYYHALDPAEIQRVPQPIRDELAILLDHSVPHPVLDANGNPMLNRKGRPIVRLKNSDINSCLGTRSTKLRIAIEGQDKTLYGIGLSDVAKQKQREQLHSEIQTAYATLESKNYNGTEKLGFTAKTLSVLKINLSMTSEDLALFNLITAEEVEIFCRQPHFTEDFIADFISQIPNGYALLLIIMEWNATTVKAAFSVMGDCVAKELKLYLNNYDRFFKILLILDLEKCRAVLEGFQSVMHHFVRITINLRHLNVLPDTHYQLFCELNREKWVEKLATPEMINHFFFFQNKNIDHCKISLTLFFEAIKSQCNSSLDFQKITLYFNDALMKLFYTQFKTHLISLTTSTDVLLPMVKILHGDNKSDFIEAIAPQLTHLILDKQKLFRLMECLKSSYCHQVLTILGADRINSYFTSLHEKRAFLYYLDEEKHAAIKNHFFQHPQFRLVRRPRNEFFQQGHDAEPDSDEDEQRHHRRRRL